MLKQLYRALQVGGLTEAGGSKFAIRMYLQSGALLTVAPPLVLYIFTQKERIALEEYAYKNGYSKEELGKAILKALKGIGLISHPSKIFKIKNPQLKIQNPIRGIGSGDVTGGAEYLTHVLGEVKTVGVPAAAPPVLWLGKP